MADDFFESFKTSVLYPGLQSIGGAVTTRVTDKISGTNQNAGGTNNSVSAVAPSGTSQAARNINASLSKVGGLGVIVPVALIGLVGAYLLLRK